MRDENRKQKPCDEKAAPARDSQRTIRARRALAMASAAWIVFAAVGYWLMLAVKALSGG
ncbi:MAG: hypothetical protein VX640_05065 [Pseudomonadota bacterium]|nr:hypothetical protein [Pseudomonadota bacterium]